MPNLQRDRAPRTNHRLDAPRLASTIVAFQPILAAPHRSRSRDAGAAGRIHSPAVGAEIVAFRPRGLALPHSTDNDDDYRHRMLINLLTAGWLATVMTGGYFALSGLVAMP